MHLRLRPSRMPDAPRALWQSTRKFFTPVLSAWWLVSTPGTAATSRSPQSQRGLTRSVTAVTPITIATDLGGDSTGSGARGGIEDLSPPTPARPPKSSDQDGEEDLEQKRRARHRREEENKPPPLPFARQRQNALRQEALTPHERSFLLEISLVSSEARTRGNKGSYTNDPTTNVDVFWRRDPSQHPGLGVWWGLRVAPFTGTGFYKDHPGAYGLTYIGPIVGVGKVDPLPVDAGTSSAKAPAGASVLGKPEGDEAEGIPSGNGWVITTGIAAVSKSGRREGNGATNDKSDDFASKGVTFDAPGVWLETRWLHIAYGALGVDTFVGVQTGSGKYFLYGGIGIGAWN